MAKIVQVLTRAGLEYDPTVANSLVRNSGWCYPKTEHDVSGRTQTGD